MKEKNEKKYDEYKQPIILENKKIIAIDLGKTLMNFIVHGEGFEKDMEQEKEYYELNRKKMDELKVSSDELDLIIKNKNAALDEIFKLPYASFKITLSPFDSYFIGEKFSLESLGAPNWGSSTIPFMGDLKLKFNNPSRDVKERVFAAGRVPNQLFKQYCEIKCDENTILGQYGFIGSNGIKYKSLIGGNDDMMEYNLCIKRILIFGYLAAVILYEKYLFFWHNDGVWNAGTAQNKKDIEVAKICADKALQILNKFIIEFKVIEGGNIVKGRAGSTFNDCLTMWKRQTNVSEVILNTINIAALINFTLELISNDKIRMDIVQQQVGQADGAAHFTKEENAAREARIKVIMEETERRRTEQATQMIREEEEIRMRVARAEEQKLKAESERTQFNLKNIAYDNAQAGPVFISGATGPYSTEINGFYTVSGAEGSDGRPVLIKKDSINIEIEHIGKKWLIKNFNESRSDLAFAYIDCEKAIEKCAIARWYVRNELGAWIPQSNVEIVFGNDAIEKAEATKGWGSWGRSWLGMSGGGLKAVSYQIDNRVRRLEHHPLLKAIDNTNSFGNFLQTYLTNAFEYLEKNWLLDPNGIYKDFFLRAADKGVKAYSLGKSIADDVSHEPSLIESIDYFLLKEYQEKWVSNFKRNVDKLLLKKPIDKILFSSAYPNAAKLFEYKDGTWFLSEWATENKVRLTPKIWESVDWETLDKTSEVELKQDILSLQAEIEKLHQGDYSADNDKSKKPGPLKSDAEYKYDEISYYTKKYNKMLLQKYYVDIKFNPSEPDQKRIEKVTFSGRDALEAFNSELLKNYDIKKEKWKFLGMELEFNTEGNDRLLENYQEINSKLRNQLWDVTELMTAVNLRDRDKRDALFSKIAEKINEEKGTDFITIAGGGRGKKLSKQKLYNLGRKLSKRKLHNIGKKRSNKKIINRRKFSRKL